MADDGSRAAPELECDLVMKGGVTSGVVYPYAILELAKGYRFRSIGGASAGAIAAAFAAAAEYARQSGDAAAFDRFKTRCDTIPDVLGGLFQANPPFQPLMRAALAMTGPKAGRVGAVLGAFAAPLATGAVVALAAYAALVAILSMFSGGWAALLAGVPGGLIAVPLGAVASLTLHLWKLVKRDLPAHDFGLCSGLRPPGSTQPVLTEWLHESLQLLAFGAAGRAKPLTFGDLKGAGVDLRMMTTNLSLQRPHALPELLPEMSFDPAEWDRLFPASVMAYLGGESVCPADPKAPGHRSAPQPDDLPIIVGVRMSLSFPVLFRTVPMHLPDRGAAARGELARGAAAPVRRVLFSDGGLSSNFPVHFFDELLPSRPTFALSLDDLLPGTEGAPRVSMPQDAAAGSFSPIREISGLGGFAAAILNSAKDWQDSMLSVMPGQRQRVVRIRLSSDEGGLNLNMGPGKSRKLMEYGRQAGEEVRTAFDFEEHRWRRTLVAYEQIERLVRSVGAAWPGYSSWYGAYLQHPKSYDQRIPLGARETIKARLDAFAAPADATFTPALADTVDFPRPSGRLRVVPDV